MYRKVILKYFSLTLIMDRLCCVLHVTLETTLLVISSVCDIIWIVISPQTLHLFIACTIGWLVNQ